MMLHTSLHTPNSISNPPPLMACQNKKKKEKGLLACKSVGVKWRLEIASDWNLEKYSCVFEINVLWIKTGKPDAQADE